MKNPAVSGGGRLRLDLATSNRLRPFRRPDSGKTSWSTRIAVGAGYCLQNGKPRKSDAFPNGDGFPIQKACGPLDARLLAFEVTA
jgi:hypothetical protein